MKVFIYRKAAHCPYEWAEVEQRLPVHPADLEDRVRHLVARGTPFATQSDIVLAILGWLVRNGRGELWLSVVYVKEDGNQVEIPMDARGDLLMPLPEDEPGSIQGAGFAYRYR